MNRAQPIKISRALHQVFANVYFVDLKLRPDLEIEEVFLADETYVKGTIAFMGPSAGHLCLYLPYGLARAITLNFLDLDARSSVGMTELVETAENAISLVLDRFLSLAYPSGKCRPRPAQVQVVNAWDGEQEVADNKADRLLFNTHHGPMVALFWL